MTEEAANALFARFYPNINPGKLSMNEFVDYLQRIGGFNAFENTGKLDLETIEEKRERAIKTSKQMEELGIFD